ncbi:MAG: lysylphosphatidylglycerol synthase transmembrane domain-containing protein [Candidatus Omnitrophota bacterium]
MNKKVSLILKLVITVGILFVLFRLVPYHELLDVYRRSNKVFILYGFLVNVFIFMLTIFRWKLLLSSLGIKASTHEAFSASFSGLFFNLIFPSFVAGDIFRGFSISNRHGQSHKVASSVLMDRFSGAFGLTIVALFSFIFGRKLLPHGQILIALFILCAIVGFVSLLIFSKTFFSFFARIFKKGSPLKEKVVSFHDQLYFFRKNPKVFLKSLLISVPVQALVAVMFFITSKAFDLHVSIMYFFILVPLIMMIALIPITIGGIGTREAAVVYFFSFVGIAKSVSLGLSLLNLAFGIILGLFGGIFYVTVHHRRLQPRS